MDENDCICNKSPRMDGDSEAGFAFVYDCLFFLYFTEGVWYVI